MMHDERGAVCLGVRMLALQYSEYMLYTHLIVNQREDKLATRVIVTALHASPFTGDEGKEIMALWE